MHEKIKELIDMLNGRKYCEEMTKEIEQFAIDNKFVIVFGSSDDLIEFRGAIDDEANCYDDGHFYINQKGFVENKCENEDCPYYHPEKEGLLIKAIWCSALLEFSWIYEIEIPYKSFEIFEDGEKYCRGIVFAFADLPEATK